MNLALRYRIQAERDYRRALEEFQRLERLRPKLPNEPDLLTEPDGTGDIAKPWELCPWIPKPHPQETTPAAAEPASPAAQVEPVAANPPSGNLPVAAWRRSSNSLLPRASASRNVATNPKPERVQSRRGRRSASERSPSDRSASDRSAPERPAPKSLTQRPQLSSPNPRPLPPASGHNPLKPPR